MFLKTWSVTIFGVVSFYSPLCSTVGIHIDRGLQKLEELKIA